MQMLRTFDCGGKEEKKNTLAGVHEITEQFEEILFFQLSIESLMVNKAPIKL